MIITRSPLANHARRRRHRPAVLLPRAWRLPDCRCDRQVRLHHGHAAVHAGNLPEVLQARARRDPSTDRAPDHPRGDPAGRIQNAAVEITTLADIPAGTGLGSSGSFTTALLKALYAHQRRLLHPRELAAAACEIEIDRLKEPIGKQDQYIAAYGGLTCFTFHQDGSVER